MVGHENIKPSWTSYYKGTDAIILVVDSTDRGRVGIAKVQDAAQVAADSELLL